MESEKIFFDQTRKLMQQFLAGATLSKGMSCVISCSVSRVEGKREDTTGDPGIARAICKAIWDMKPEGLWLVVQCCEHLNRALIIERNLMLQKNLEEVNVLPTPKAGGTFAAIACQFFQEPVVVEEIKAEMGLDIGLTMIGMHLKPVVLPMLLETEFVGGARVVAARTRPRLIGGERSKYK